MFNKHIRIVLAVVISATIINAQEVIQAGTARFQKRIAELLTHIDTTLSKARQEVTATFDSTQEVSRDMQKAFVAPVESLVSKLNQLPNKYNEAARKVRQKNMQGLNDIGNLTRQTISDTLRTVSSLVKNISAVGLDKPIAHIAQLLEIAVSSFKMLKAILEASVQDIFVTLSEGKDLAIQTAQKTLAQINAVVGMLQPLVQELQDMALEKVVGLL